MTFCCEIDLDGVKYKSEYRFYGKQFKFSPKPDDETEQRLIPRVYRAMDEYFSQYCGSSEYEVEEMLIPFTWSQLL